MIKKYSLALILSAIVILLPMLAGIIMWNELPDEIPSHWNIKGEIDAWSSKPFAVFGLSGIMLAIQALSVFCSFSDPKRKNNSQKILNITLWIVPVVSVVLFSAVYASALGATVAIEIMIPVLVGVLFVIIGNYLPKCKQNYTVGIKISWTLNNEENWNKTHRLAGWIMVIAGMIIIITGFFKIVWAVVALLPITIAVPIAYSYILHRKGL